MLSIKTVEMVEIIDYTSQRIIWVSSIDVFNRITDLAATAQRLPLATPEMSNG
jgi:hypothetical protein